MKTLVTIILLFTLVACGNDDADLPITSLSGSGSCEWLVEKQEIVSIMQQWYLWNDEAEQFNKYSADLSTIDNSEELLGFLRYRPAQFDRFFTFITSPAKDEAFFGAGQYVGFGWSVMQDQQNNVWINSVFANSPADNAGAERGYRIISIDGRSIPTIIANEGFGNALGPEEIGVTREFVLRDRSNNTVGPISISKALVTIDPVPVAEILRDNGGQAIAGYLVLRTFINTAEAPLRNAFALFQQESIRDVIIDLRYNGGGLVATSRVLASLLAGPANVGNIYTRFEFNSASAASNNMIDVFSAETNSIDLDRVIFITSGNSASASEMVINGLSPYFTGGKQLDLVGSKTFGKPVGQSGISFCDNSLLIRVVSFATTNVNSNGAYFNGLPVNCSASDDLSKLLGDPNEGMLDAAVSFLTTGQCPITASINQTTTASTAPKYLPIEGNNAWQQFSGAY